MQTPAQELANNLRFVSYATTQYVPLLTPLGIWFKTKLIPSSANSAISAPALNNSVFIPPSPSSEFPNEMRQNFLVLKGSISVMVQGALNAFPVKIVIP
jgi:hypothetical protein